MAKDQKNVETLQRSTKIFTKGKIGNSFGNFAIYTSHNKITTLHQEQSNKNVSYKLFFSGMMADGVKIEGYTYFIVLLKILKYLSL